MLLALCKMLSIPIPKRWAPTVEALWQFKIEYICGSGATDAARPFDFFWLHSRGKGKLSYHIVYWQGLWCHGG